MTAKKLVIVESPAKARTIANYLGSDYHVQASIGHIRDLPQPSELPADMKKGPYGKFAVDVEHGFTPYYVVDSDKKKTVSELKKALKESDELYLATDEDREGEAIAWHLLEVLQPKVPIKRMVFHEITREAIQRALENTRELDLNLVDAQETRRILDRLYGYELSPLLWRKVRPGLSAGRVQSVATRLVVERERERMAFVPANWCDILVNLASTRENGGEFQAKSNTLAGVKIATSRDFTDAGELTAAAEKAGVRVLEPHTAKAVGEILESPSTGWIVTKVETKPYTRRPSPPFTTSTLQQEASRKLRISSRETMRIAQSLYENGYITYMRTDSVALSKQAIAAARSQAAEKYGPELVPEKPRVYATKAKGAQEAHEAIRPAGEHFRTPDQLQGQLDSKQLALYTLIWKRTVASQMVDATGSTVSAVIRARLAKPIPSWTPASPETAQEAEFTASGTTIKVRGFLAAYEEGRDASRYDDAQGEAHLPSLEKAQSLQLKEVDASAERQHTTTPPPRYTEASLVKALEERGIGRPSTYAATISVISDRGYVVRRGQALVPTWLAFSVTRLLEENLPELVDYDFTASMENDLDQIAAGQMGREAWLENFYHGKQGAAGKSALEVGLEEAVASLGNIDAAALNSTDLGEGVTLRVGRYGPYIQSGEQRASVPENLAPDELNLEKARELLASNADDGRELGKDPATGRAIVVKNGRYGPYVTEVLEDGADKKAKPRTGSLFKSMTMESVTLEQALQLLSLPREVGTSADGTVITAQNGRYGPYLKKGTDSRSLGSEEEIFTITLEQAEAIFAQPKTRGRGGRTAAAPLKEFGADPVSGKPVVAKDGRFGPYVTDGTTNATIPRGESAEEMTAARAFELLQIKREKGPAKRKAPARKKATARKSTAKKAK